MVWAFGYRALRLLGSVQSCRGGTAEAPAVPSTSVSFHGFQALGSFSGMHLPRT